MKSYFQNVNFFNNTKFNRNDFSIIIAHALDYYDTALYGLLAPVLAPLFFPEQDLIVQLILTYSTLASSAVTRPIGAFVFGMVAKRFGAMRGLSYSLIGMAFSSIFIGLLPGVREIGWVAALFLVLARMSRGFFAAGESTIAKLYILEGKQAHQALTVSHFYQSSAMLGMVVASIAATLAILFPTNDFFWRFCFCLGGLAGLTGYFLRRSSLLNENNHYQNCPVNLANINKKPNIKAFWEHRGNILRVALVTTFSYLTYVIPFVFMNSFIPLITHVSLEKMMALNTTLVIFDMVTIPIIGRFLQNFSASKIMIFASLALASTIIPLFDGLPGASFTYITLVRIWLVFCGIIFLCPMNLWLKNLFESKDRYLLVGMGTALGAGTLGRLTPAICLALWYKTEVVLFPAVYLALLILSVAFAIYSIKLATIKSKPGNSLLTTGV